MSPLNKTKSNALYFFLKLCIDESGHFKKNSLRNHPKVFFFLNNKILNLKKKKRKRRRTHNVLTKSKKKKKKKKVRNVKRGGDSFVQIFSQFSPNFLSNLERMYFEGGGEKTCRPHRNLSFFLPLTKQPKTSFSLHFSLLHFPSSLKSPQPNTP